MSYFLLVLDLIRWDWFLWLFSAMDGLIDLWEQMADHQVHALFRNNWIAIQQQLSTMPDGTGDFIINVKLFNLIFSKSII